MPWNPEIYNQFKEERYLPFYDLADLIEYKPGMKVIDLGCGTGELTAMLAGRLTESHVIGIDSSKEMLAKAPEQNNLEFRELSIEAFLSGKEKWNLIFANASLQWVDNHYQLFSDLIAALLPGGQIAVQIPAQHDNELNRILLQLVQEEPYKTALNSWVRTSPVLTLDGYTKLFFDHHPTRFTVLQKVYPVIAKDPDDLFNFISGSTLVPYFEMLDEPIRIQLTKEFKERIHRSFPVLPAIYAFKRILLHAVF